jgi:hypothetical protein
MPFRLNVTSLRTNSAHAWRPPCAHNNSADRTDTAPVSRETGSLVISNAARDGRWKIGIGEAHGGSTLVLTRDVI